MALAAPKFSIVDLSCTVPRRQKSKPSAHQHPALTKPSSEFHLAPRCTRVRVIKCKATDISPSSWARAEDKGKNWVPVLPLAALPKGDRRVIKQDGETVLLLWYKDDVFAIENRSPAAGAYSEGLLNAKLTQDGCIVCPSTDSTFDLRTGDIKEWCPKNPILRAPTLPPRNLVVYPVRMDGENIYISLNRSLQSDTSTEIVVSGKANPGINFPVELESAANTVRKFYDGINCRDLESVVDLIAADCIYEDLVFPTPFVGRESILDFFRQFMDSISRDLQFAIDDISEEEDASAVGVTWHLEWKGKPFPFSRGCSFYRLNVINGQRQIVYGRDCVEPAVKPGDTALAVIRGVTWLLEKFPTLADRL